MFTKQTESFFGRIKTRLVDWWMIFLLEDLQSTTRQKKEEKWIKRKLKMKHGQWNQSLVISVTHGFMLIACLWWNWIKDFSVVLGRQFFNTVTELKIFRQPSFVHKESMAMATGNYMFTGSGLQNYCMPELAVSLKLDSSNLVMCQVSLFSKPEIKF